MPKKPLPPILKALPHTTSQFRLLLSKSLSRSQFDEAAPGLRRRGGSGAEETLVDQGADAEGTAQTSDKIAFFTDVATVGIGLLIT